MKMPIAVLRERALRLLIPTVLGGAISIVIIMHFFLHSILFNLFGSLPNRTEILNAEMFRIDLFVFILTIFLASIFLAIILPRLKKLTGGEIGTYISALESARNHIIITDIDGRILFANKGAEEMTGYSSQEMIGNTPRLWGALMPASHYKNLWQTIKYDRKTFSAEVKNRRKNQDVYYALMHISPIFDEHNNLTGFVSTEDDVTKKKEMEQNLQNVLLATGNVLEDLQIEKDLIKQSEKKYRALVDTMQEGLGVQDKNGKIIFMNRCGCEMLGYTLKELLGKPTEFVFDEDNRKILHDQMGKRHKGQRQSYEIAWLRKDGSTIDTITSPNPRFDDAGNLVESVAVFTDITKEKAIDKAKTEFVSLASHQLRTPLSTVKWYTEMLLAGDAGRLSVEQSQFAQEIYHGNQRMVELVDALLNVSRLELGTFVVEPEDCDLKVLYGEVEDNLLALLSNKKIKVTTHFKNLPTVKFDKKMMHIIMENLLSNAIKYTPDGGKVDLKVQVIKQGDTIGEKTVKENSIAIIVSDTGYGIPKNQQNRIFTKLFRADNVLAKDTDGTGLGLYIIKSIIDHSGGMIWFNSPSSILSVPSGIAEGKAENQGTTMYVTLPLGGMKKKAGTKTLE